VLVALLVVVRFHESFSSIGGRSKCRYDGQTDKECDVGRFDDRQTDEVCNVPVPEQDFWISILSVFTTGTGTWYR
jgi:hypothetical protein